MNAKTRNPITTRVCGRLADRPAKSIEMFLLHRRFPNCGAMRSTALPSSFACAGVKSEFSFFAKT